MNNCRCGQEPDLIITDVGQCFLCPDYCAIGPVKASLIEAQEAWNLMFDRERVEELEAKLKWHDSDEIPDGDYDCLIKLGDGGYTIGHYQGRWNFDVGIIPSCKFKWRKI